MFDITRNGEKILAQKNSSSEIIETNLEKLLKELEKPVSKLIKKFELVDFKHEQEVTYGKFLVLPS